MKKIILFIAITLSITSCTENARARRWGGKEGMVLMPNEILINVAWKADNLWVLTTDTLTGVNYLREHSSWGVWEGAIIIESSSAPKPKPFKSWNNEKNRRNYN